MSLVPKDLVLVAKHGTVLFRSFRAAELRLELVEEVLSETRSVRSIDAGAAFFFLWEAIAHAMDGFGDFLDAAVEAGSAQELFDGPAFEES